MSTPRKGYIYEKGEGYWKQSMCGVVQTRHDAGIFEENVCPRGPSCTFEPLEKEMHIEMENLLGARRFFEGEQWNKMVLDKILSSGVRGGDSLLGSTISSGGSGGVAGSGCLTAERLEPRWRHYSIAEYLMATQDTLNRAKANDLKDMWKKACGEYLIATSGVSKKRLLLLL